MVKVEMGYEVQVCGRQVKENCKMHKEPQRKGRRKYTGKVMRMLSSFQCLKIVQSIQGKRRCGSEGAQCQKVGSHARTILGEVEGKAQEHCQQILPPKNAKN